MESKKDWINLLNHSTRVSVLELHRTQQQEGDFSTMALVKPFTSNACTNQTSETASKQPMRKMKLYSDDRVVSWPSTLMLAKPPSLDQLIFLPSPAKAERWNMQFKFYLSAA
jgi:hypothetical protein